MIWQIFSPGKVSSCFPFSIGEDFDACYGFRPNVETSSNKQGLFETQKKDNRTTCGYSHLLPIADAETGACVVVSFYGQVGKGIRVIYLVEFVVVFVPRTEREWWQLWFEHLSTFPWRPRSPKPPIVTNWELPNGRAHPLNTQFLVLFSCTSPLIKQNIQF